MTEIVTDCKGTALQVGSRVRAGLPVEGDAGTVTLITEPDGDIDDDTGRGIQIMPRVHVRFDDGVVDDFVTSWTAQGPWDEDAPFMCDDVEVIA